MSPSDELFPTEAVQMDSPRLAWMKRHEIRTWFSKHIDPEDGPWIAWLRSNAGEEDGIPRDLDACGYGVTEDEALQSLARRHKFRLWNEEEAP